MPIQELMISELPALPPVPSGEIPVSQMNGTALVTAKATVQQLVQSVAPRQHSHTPADIGLGNVNNTSDANKPVSGPTATAIANALQAHVNATNPHEQYATTAQVTQVVTAQAGGLAPVQSVNGQQGAVTITKASIGLGNVADLSPADMPVSNATATALAAAISGHLAAADPHPQYATAAAAPVQSVNGMTGSVTITKAGIGLGNVADLAPADMPVSTAVAAALGSKLDAAALAPALAGKIDSADARFTGIQRQKAQLIAGGTGARVLDPNTAAVMIDTGTSGIGGRTYTIAPITADENDLVWFDYMFAHNSQPFLFSGVKALATGVIADQTTLPMPPGSDMAVLRFFRMPARSFNAGNWFASCIA